MIPMSILYCRIALFTVECTAMFTECGSVDLKHSAAWNKLLKKKNLFIKICRINCSKSALFTKKLCLLWVEVLYNFSSLACATQWILFALSTCIYKTGNLRKPVRKRWELYCTIACEHYTVSRTVAIFA